MCCFEVHLNVAIVCEREVKRKFIAGVIVLHQGNSQIKLEIAMINDEKFQSLELRFRTQ